MKDLFCEGLRDGSRVGRGVDKGGKLLKRIDGGREGRQQCRAWGGRARPGHGYVVPTKFAPVLLLFCLFRCQLSEGLLGLWMLSLLMLQQQAGPQRSCGRRGVSRFQNADVKSRVP
jgi:hypothetical protein